MAEPAPAVSYILTLRVELTNVPGTLGRLTSAIGHAEADIGTIDLVGLHGGTVTRDIAVRCNSDAHAQQVVAAAGAIDGVRVVSLSDATFDLHQGGKLRISAKAPMKTADDLAMAYTPGVGRVSQAIADDPSRVWELTGRGNAVAVLSDGSAVLGLGNIGPEAALPVMEGKAILFKEFGDIDAYPVCIRASGPDEIVAVAKAVAPTFGGINLEDIAAPACFEVEERLKRELDIPVFHDDQHGTAIVLLAALQNAAKVVGRPIGAMRAVFLGAGAAGIACAKLLVRAGISDVVMLDRKGTLHAGRTDDLSPEKRWIVEHTNADGIAGGLDEALKGADVFIGLSGPRMVTGEQIALLRDEAIVFALANPVPEILPELVPGNVAVVATGRSDYPNQINNVLVFPGVFRGLLDARARDVDDELKVEAARAIASLVAPEELAADWIIPSVFDRRVADVVAAAVRASAERTGLAQTAGGGGLTESRQ